MNPKRALDILFALVALVLTFPIMLAVAIVIRLKLGSPVLFRQLRPGLEGRPFCLVKFRTMSLKTDAAGEPLPDGARLSAIGRSLRAASLDELPVFWNVLKGDMSVVGPRPLLQEYLPLYTRKQRRRHCVRPGITGWAQVNGRNAVSWEERLAMDVWYVDNQSLRLDIEIILRTVATVFRRHGISEAGEATMSKFTGSQRGEASEV